MVVWKNSKHPEVAKAFLEALYNEEDYVKFLDSTPVGMLPTIKGLAILQPIKKMKLVRSLNMLKK